jgi:hypothetical protein
MMHRTRLKVISHSLFTFVLHALLSIATAEQRSGAYCLQPSFRAALSGTLSRQII